MKSNATFAEIAALIHASESFVVMSHMRPDGDALGCQIALGLSLRQLGKRVCVWNEDGMLEKYRFLPGAELVETPPAEAREFDVAFALDCAVHKRLGTPLEAIKAAKTWVNMDHHVSNDRYGDLVYIDSHAPATGEILYEFIRATGLPFLPAMVDNLWVAIATDTGSFQYPNTTARTFEIGAELIKAGANVGALSQRIYDSFPRRRIELLRELLNVLRFSAKDRVASFALSLAMAERAGAKPEDNENLIDTIRAIDGVMVAAFFEELPEGKVRISLRSKDPRADVCKVCAMFGGGGHTLAAGARAKGTLAEVEEKVLAAIANEIPN
jgi:phosphoesterase RecJ-like protein